MNICPGSLSCRRLIDHVALQLSAATGPACGPALCSLLGPATCRQCLACIAFLILNCSPLRIITSPSFSNEVGTQGHVASEALGGQRSSSIPGDYSVLTATSDRTVKWGEMFLLWDFSENWTQLDVFRVTIILKTCMTGLWESIDIKEFHIQFHQLLEMSPCHVAQRSPLMIRPISLSKVIYKSYQRI